MLLNRKLIIAVLTIGLMLSFSSAAIGYDDTNLKPLQPIQSLSRNQTIDAPTPVSFRNSSDIAKPTTGDNVPAGTLEFPGTRQCEDVNYTGGGFAFGYMVPSDYDETIYSSKYTTTAACTLNYIGLAQYGAWMEGTPDVTITLWAGNGSGYPTVAINSWAFPYASLSGGPQVLGVDLTADAGYPGDYMFAAGEELFVAIEAVNGRVGMLAGDPVYPYDDMDETGVIFYDNGVDPGEWMTMDESGWGSWGPGERTFFTLFDVCFEDAPLVGDCSYYSYDCGAAYLWGLYYTEPGVTGNGETHFGVRFTAALPETLKFVDIAFYDVIDDLGNSMWDGFPTAGTLPVGRVDICDPGPTGPNITTPIYTILLNDFEMDWWTSIDMINDEGVTLIMEGDYYVVVSIDGVTSVGDYDGLEEIDILSDDGSCDAGRSGLYADVVPDVWLSYSGGYNFLMNVEACADLYSTCGYDSPYGGPAYYWTVPTYLSDDGGTPPIPTMLNTGFAQAFDPAEAGCHIDHLYLWFYGEGAYAEDGEIAVYASDGAGGLPGTRLQYIPFGPTEGWNDMPFFAPNLYFEQRIWIVKESFATGLDDFSTITDAADGPGVPSAFLVDGEWMYTTDLYGANYAFAWDLYRCCMPFIVRTCAPDGDWPTMGKNFERTQSTLNEVGDIQCELTKAWTYKNYLNGNPSTLGNGVTFAQPIVADGKVFAYMFNALVCVDLNTGAELWRRDLNFAEIGGSCRATPTYHDGFVYCGGGDNGYFAKFDVATGATVWSFTMNGHAQYAPHVIMDIAGTECVVVADGLGSIYALQTSDGDNYYFPGTTNAAFTVAGQVHKGLTTDGTYLYVGCDEYLTTPNVYRLAIDGSGITVDWDLVSGVGWQLQNIVAANNWRPEASQEGCYSAILYSDEGAEGQWIYFTGSFTPQNSSPVHNGGIIYKVSADGTTLGWASETSGSTSGSPGGIIDDKATVIYGGWSNWIEGGEYYGPMAYSKATGIPQWGPRGFEPAYNIQTNPDNWGTVNQPGVLTCESIADPGQSDWLIFGNEFGYWNFADPTVGEVVWHRRSARFSTYVTGPVVDGAGHIIFGEGWNLHCLANVAPRPRLHIANMSPELPVPFGLPASYTITFPGILVNTGCAPLEIFHVELLDGDNGTFPSRVSTVNNDRAESVSAIAKENSGLKAIAATILDERAASVGFSKTTTVPAAFALPAYINSLTAPADGTIIPAGGSVDIVLDIDGTKVPRGASQFFAEIHSDDPDYFLDSAYIDYGVDAADPTVLLTVIGGCLYSSLDMAYGDGGENHIPVWNSTHIMIANAGNSSFEGETAYLYGDDGYCYSNAPERVVMHWLDGGGNPMWESILPDPLPTCDIAEEHDVVLAMMSDDGSAYSNVLGTIYNYAYVDSMEDHRVYTIDDEVTPPETTITWEWDVEFQTGLNKPYANDLTEGWAFKALVTEYAVTDVTGPKYGLGDFYDFTIARHAVYSRYGTAIPGLFVGGIADWDVADYGANVTGYSEEFSVGWIYDPTFMPFPDFGGGLVKIPFGPGYTPMINTVDATTAWFGGEEPGFDSIYVWMSRPSTQFMNYQPYGTEDKRMWNTIAELNLPAWAYTGDEDDPVPDDAFESWGVALFGKYTDHTAAAVDNYSDMAMLINKFCGFGRGDVNDDGVMNLVDIVSLNSFVHGGGNGPFPFKHLGDVNNDGAVDNLDITYMIDWYFNGGPNPLGDWALPQFVSP